MAVVCSGCGGYVAPKVDVDAETLTCPECSFSCTAIITPLFIVTGASGTGKTEVVAHLHRVLPEWDTFETDILWAADWKQAQEDWLRIAFSIAQCRRGTILCGMHVPESIDQCDHRAFFRSVNYMNLHCDDETRARRLRDRPEWRGASEEFIDEQARTARWLLENAETAFHPPLVTLDTGLLSPEETAERIREWAVEIWGREMVPRR
jgi:hypothetical protein